MKILLIHHTIYLNKIFNKKNMDFKRHEIYVDGKLRFVKYKENEKNKLLKLLNEKQIKYKIISKNIIN